MLPINLGACSVMVLPGLVTVLVTLAGLVIVVTLAGLVTVLLTLTGLKGT